MPRGPSFEFSTIVIVWDDNLLRDRWHGRRREILIVLVGTRIWVYRLIANAASAVRLLIASLS